MPLMTTCTYCGFPAECRDHVVPVSMKRVFRNYRRKEIVPACLDCNRLSGDYPAYDVLSKAMFLLRKYEMALKKDKTGNWTEAEIEGLDHSLKMFVKSRVERKSDLRKKIRSLELVCQGFNPIQWYEQKEIQAHPDQLPEMRGAILEEKTMG